MNTALLALLFTLLEVAMNQQCTPIIQAGAQNQPIPSLESSTCETMKIP